MTAELAMLSTLRGRARRSIGHRLNAEARHLASLRARPVLAAPGAALERGTSEVLALLDRGRRCAVARLDRALERGCAVVQLADGTVVRSAEQVSAEAKLRVRVADGEFTAKRP